MSRPGWRQPVKIADAVASTLQRLGVEGRVRQHEIWRVWPAVVGSQIAQHAQPHAFWHGRMVIHVTDSVWLHHLSMLRHRLMAALNEQLKPAEIREIVLRVGEVATAPIGPSPRPAPPEPTSAIDPALLAEIERALAPLGDVPFRDALRQLWLRASRESAHSPDTTGHSQPR
jgi:Dna[CI] antecedent, DciA